MPNNIQILTNAEIADRLSTLAQLLSMEKANPYKIKAYRRASNTIRVLGESVDELVRSSADLTVYSGIGEAISGAIREIVLTGSLASLEKLRSNASPELLSISTYPRLDPKRVLRIFKKLHISSVEALHEALESGAIERIFGSRTAQHVRQGLVQTGAVLLYHAHDLVLSIETYLLKRAGAVRVEAVGDYRRRVEVIEELSFVVETEDFAKLTSQMERYGGRIALVESNKYSAVFALSSGPLLRIALTDAKNWGLSLIRRTGNKAHLKKLVAVSGSLTSLETKSSFPTERSFYDSFGIAFIEPELREGLEEVRQARRGTLPTLITEKDIQGDLHMHTEASDGSNSIEQMVAAAEHAGYAYIGISDHSQSLKIAGGVSEEKLWAQIRKIEPAERASEWNPCSQVRRGRYPRLRHTRLFGRTAARVGLHSLFDPFSFRVWTGETDRADPSSDGQQIFYDHGTRNGPTSFEALRLRDRHGAYRCPRKADWLFF